MRSTQLVSFSFILALTLGLGLAAPSGALSCGDTIYASTVLTHDLSCPFSGIAIGDDHVVLDLNGHTISGPGFGIGSGTGIIVLTGTNDVRIVGPGTVTGFHIGVTAFDSERVDVEGVTFTHHAGSGIAYHDTGESLIRGNAFTDNGTAVGFQSLVTPRGFNRVIENEIDGTGVTGSGGIRAEGEVDLEIASNLVLGMDAAAVQLLGVERAVVEGNILAYGDTAIVLFPYPGSMQDNAILQNKIYDNARGIYALTSGGAGSIQTTWIKDNVFQGGTRGIVLEDSLVIDSQLVDNHLWGVTTPIADAGTATVSIGNTCDGLPC